MKRNAETTQRQPRWALGAHVMPEAQRLDSLALPGLSFHHAPRGSAAG